MKKNILSLTIAIILASCGGGGGGSSSAIEGTWRGDLYQGVILCSDGTGIGAGGGSVIRQVELDITGSDTIGSVVQAIDDTCLLEGSRSEKGFQAEAVSGCDQGLIGISFELLEDGSASLSYSYDINKVVAGPNGVRCIISPSGNVER